jgi:tetratricopeptide (TPR) repeat protein
MGETEREAPLVAELTPPATVAAPGEAPPAPLPARRGFILGRWGGAALRWIVRRRWRLLAVVALLALVGVGAWLIGVHLWANYHLRAARAALERYHDDEARRHLEACLKVWPRNPDVLLLMARAARRGSAYDVADGILDRYQEVRGSDDDLVLERMLLRAERGQLSEVSDFCQARLEQDHPAAPLVFEALTRGLMRVYQLQKAEECLRDWLQRQPDNTQAHLYLATVFEMTERLSDALATYRRGLEIDPQRDDLRLRLATLLLRMGSAEDALPHLEFLHRRQPEDLQIQVHLARCHEQKGDRAEAERLLDGVLDRQADFVPALAERGRLASLAGQSVRAEACLRRAVQVDPGDYSTRYQLYLCLVRNGKAEEARRELARLKVLENDLQRLQKILSAEMQQTPNNPDLHCEVGEIALRSSSLEEARRWFETALKHAPNHPRAHKGLAQVYSRIGNPGLAARHQSLARASGVARERSSSPPSQDRRDKPGSLPKDRRDKPGGSR